MFNDVGRQHNVCSSLCTCCGNINLGEGSPLGGFPLMAGVHCRRLGASRSTQHVAGRTDSKKSINRLVRC